LSGVEGARSRSVDTDSNRRKVFDDTRTDFDREAVAGFPKSFLPAERAGEDLDRGQIGVAFARAVVEP